MRIKLSGSDSIVLQGANLSGSLSKQSFSSAAALFSFLLLRYSLAQLGLVLFLCRHAFIIFLYKSFPNIV